MQFPMSIPRLAITRRGAPHTNPKHACARAGDCKSNWYINKGLDNAALRLLGLKHLEDVGGWKNNRTECSHVPIRRRERKAQKFRSEKAAQRFLSSHGQIYNLFNYRRHLISRLTLRKFRTHAQSEWSIGTAAACN